MVKRSILAILIFIFITWFLGIIIEPVRAQECTIDNGPSGVCTLKEDCNEANSNIEWDNPSCEGNYGCCGIEDGAPENQRSGLGEQCETSRGWVGYCWTKNMCPQGRSGIAFDVTTCKAGGCCGSETGEPISGTAHICSSVSDPVQNEQCMRCDGVWTAIGCITTDPNNLLSSILRIALGLAGGIAFLLILFGGLQIMTSAGNPEQLNAGRELISSAIIGLIIILFSIFLLQFIGVNIIGIPGFTS